MRDKSSKIVPENKLFFLTRKLKKQGKKIVTTNGAFDMLHVGHILLLEKSKSLGDILIVGINSDSSVKQYKSEKRPIIPEAERARLVAALTCVDYITIFNEPDPVNFLELVKPAIHTKGGDYDSEKLIETVTVLRNGGEVVIISDRIQWTTEIINRLIERYSSKNSQK